MAKNRDFILNLWLLFKGMVEDCVQILYNYFTLENKVWNFYNIFTKDVVCIFIQKHILPCLIMMGFSFLCVVIDCMDMYKLMFKITNKNNNKKNSSYLGS